MEKKINKIMQTLQWKQQNPVTHANKIAQQDGEAPPPPQQAQRYVRTKLAEGEAEGGNDNYGDMNKLIKKGEGILPRKDHIYEIIAFKSNFKFPEAKSIAYKHGKPNQIFQVDDKYVFRFSKQNKEKFNYIKPKELEDGLYQIIAKKKVII